MPKSSRSWGARTTPSCGRWCGMVSRRMLRGHSTTTDSRPIEGMLSHQLKQNIINGDKTIIQNPNEGQRKEHEKCDFEKHEVYGLDVIISTGEGTVRSGTRTRPGGRAGLVGLTWDA